LNPALFFNVVVPLMSVEHTALLAITSPGDDQNYVSIIQDLKNADGQPLMRNVRVGMACDQCIKSGVECKHKYQKLPAWKSEDRHELMTAVYKQNDNARKREIDAQVLQNHERVFSRNDINHLAEAAPYQLKYEVQVIEVGIDPSGGGPGSEYTIVSSCVEDGNDVVSKQF
jgi:hypothetical protein